MTKLDTRQLDQAPSRMPLAHGAGLGVERFRDRLLPILADAFPFA